MYMIPLCATAPAPDLHGTMLTGRAMQCSDCGCAHGTPGLSHYLGCRWTIACILQNRTISCCTLSLIKWNELLHLWRCGFAGTRSSAGTPTPSLPYDSLICLSSMSMAFTPGICQPLSCTQLCGHTIPRDTLICLSPYCMDRSEAIYGPDSESFKPERCVGCEDSV